MSKSAMTTVRAAIMEQVEGRRLFSTGPNSYVVPSIYDSYASVVIETNGGPDPFAGDGEYDPFEDTTPSGAQANASLFGSSGSATGGASSTSPTAILTGTTIVSSQASKPANHEGVGVDSDAAMYIAYQAGLSISVIGYVSGYASINSPASGSGTSTPRVESTPFGDVTITNDLVVALSVPLDESGTPDEDGYYFGSFSASAMAGDTGPYPNSAAFATYVIYEPLTTTVLGDINGDGVVNELDVMFQTLPGTVRDLNGDSIADSSDRDYLIQTILGTRDGDCDLNGRVDITDKSVLLANIGTVGGYAQGDLNGDFHIDSTDLAILNSNLGFGVPNDRNHDGQVNRNDADITGDQYGDSDDIFLQFIQEPGYATDFNGDSLIDGDDFDFMFDVFFQTKLGDLDLDRDVDAYDLYLFDNNGAPTGYWYADGDVNLDGIVDSTDRDILLANYGFGT